MVVSAIDDTNMYFQKYQYQVFGQVISATKFRALMRQYGVRETGNAYLDVQALYKAMSSTATNLVDGKLPKNSVEPQAIAWAALMSRVGLSASGDFSEDYNRFNSKVDEMNKSAQGNSIIQANVSQLRAEAAVVFTDAAKNILAQQGVPQPTASALDIKTMLDKMYYLGGVFS